MKILVTGGAGFLGSHLCDFLVKKKNKVICIDNLFTSNKKNIEHLLENKKFDFIEHDIIKPFFAKEHIDMIYNLACPASPVHYQENAIRTIKTNVLGTVNMLGLAKLHNARILQASTSEIYGDPLEHPQKESYWGNVNPIGIRSSYDEGKRVAETLFYDYYRQHNTDIRIVRIFNTYGPKMAKNDGRVISNFILQSLNNKPITVYGDGSQTRSFCYVDDLINGIYKIMSKDFFGPINLGNPEEFTILELAEKIIQLTGSKSKIVHKKLPEDDPIKRKPDITKAKSLIGWEPKISLEEGLKKTIEYFKQC